MSTLQTHYLRLYKKADDLLKQPDNPCAIRRTPEGNISCNLTRTRNIHETPTCHCCFGCKHLGPEGCTVKALGCKLGWCYISSPTISGMSLTDHPTFEKLRAIRQEARALRIPEGARNSYEEIFPDV